MLVLNLPADEEFDSTTNEFIYNPEVKNIQFEHSLLSLSKWEMHYHKPFLSKQEKTTEETIYYLKCMCLNDRSVPDNTFNRIARNPSLVRAIHEYLENPMSATTFSDNENKPNNSIITNELIYYDMIALQIPIDFEKWHLNRLLTLIKVCSIKNQPPKKMSKSEIYARNAKMNAERKAKMNTKG